MKQIVREQILKVRNTRETNMFDRNMVMQIANREGWYELVAYLADSGSHKEYVHFILTGEAEMED
nr:DUF5049 domain-containing protein [uncultured Acetatifactor sp.]